MESSGDFDPKCSLFKKQKIANSSQDDLAIESGDGIAVQELCLDEGACGVSASKILQTTNLSLDDGSKLDCFSSSYSKSLHGEDEYNHHTDGLIYIETSCYGPGCDSSLYESLHKGCQCNGFCDQSCSCGISFHEKKYSFEYTGPVLECNDLCKCSLTCTNRVSQNGPMKYMDVRNISGKGLGLVTKVMIPEGTFVCEYAGEYIGSDIAKERFSQLKQSDSNYILVVRESSSEMITTIIDPTVVGNIGRYINHSCNPNLQIVPIRINSMFPIAALFALTDIPPNTELTYDYSCSFNMNVPLINTDGDHKAQINSESNLDSQSVVVHGSRKCLCQSLNCRGFIPFDKVL